MNTTKSRVLSFEQRYPLAMGILMGAIQWNTDDDKGGRASKEEIQANLRERLQQAKSLMEHGIDPFADQSDKGKE